jgi:hypothetical protein
LVEWQVAQATLMGLPFSSRVPVKIEGAAAGFRIATG